MSNLTIRDAFKALEDVEERIEVGTTKHPKLSEGKNGKNKTPIRKRNLKEGLSYGEIAKIEDEWKKYKEEKGDASADTAAAFIQEKGYDYDEVFGLISVIEEPGDEVKESVNKLDEAPVYQLDTRYDSRQSFYGKAKVDVKDDGTKILYSYGTPVCKITSDNKVVLMSAWNYSVTTLRHVKEFLKQHGFKAESIKQIRQDYVVESKEVKNNKQINESESIDLTDKEDIKKGKKLLKAEDEEPEEEQIVDVDAETVTELKDSYIGNVILQCPVCRTLLYKKPEALQQDEEDAEIYNKEEDCPHCGAKDGFELVGQVASLNVDAEEENEDSTGKVEVADKEETTDVDLINAGRPEEESIKLAENFTVNHFNIPGFELQVKDEFEDEGVKGFNIIYSKNGVDIVEIEIWEVDSPISVTKNLYRPNLMNSTYDSFDGFASDLEYKAERYFTEQLEEDFTFESLDDKSFNKLVTRYINEVYDNVDKFESTDGTIDDVANNFIVEGVVTYKNGKQAKTKFVFEAVAKTKSGSYKFKGSNKMFTEAKKPFTLISTIKDNTLYCEELKYHYNVTVLNESKKVKGKIALKNN